MRTTLAGLALVVTTLPACSSSSTTATTRTFSARPNTIDIATTSTSSTTAVPPAPTRTTSSQRVTWMQAAGSAGNVWLLGTYRCSHHSCLAIARSTNGRRTFVRVGAPSIRLPYPSSPGAEVASLQFANADDGYVTAWTSASSDSVFWTGDGGEHWREVSLGAPLVSAIVTTAGRAYGLVVALVATCPLNTCAAISIASSSVTSSTWTNTPFVITRPLSNPVITAFGSKLWLVTTPGGGLHVNLRVSHDGGRHFSNLATSGWGGVFCRAAATSPQALWAFCSTGMTGYAVRSTDGGRHFVTLAFQGALNSADIVPVSDDVAVYVLNEDGIRVTTDGGRHFHPSLSFKVPATFSLAVASGTTWLTVVFLPRGEQLWRTTNAGHSWTEVPLPTLDNP